MYTPQINMSQLVIGADYDVIRGWIVLFKWKCQHFPRRAILQGKNKGMSTDLRFRTPSVSLNRGKILALCSIMLKSSLPEIDELSCHVASMPLLQTLLICDGYFFNVHSSGDEWSPGRPFLCILRSSFLIIYFLPLVTLVFCCRKDMLKW